MWKKNNRLSPVHLANLFVAPSARHDMFLFLRFVLFPFEKLLINKVKAILKVQKARLARGSESVYFGRDLLHRAACELPARDFFPQKFNRGSLIVWTVNYYCI